MRYRWPPAILLLLTVSLPVRSQQKERIVDPEGTEAFRNLLHSLGLTPVKKIQDLGDLDPAETIIVILGDNAILDEVAPQIGGLERFKNKRGAILIASDRATGSRLDDFKVRINGAEIVDPDRAYQNLASCPMLSESPKKTHPVFKWLGSGGIATNHPSLLEFTKAGRPADNFEILATFSPSATSISRIKGRRRLLPFMIGSKGSDRVLVLAGHSVFMNMLLAQEDNDNIMFAFGCARWLSESPAGHARKYALFVEDGRIIDRFNAGLTGPPKLPIPPVRVLNQMLRGLESKNSFNRLLLESFDREQILRPILFGCSTVLLLYSAWRLYGARQFPEAVTPIGSGVGSLVDDLSVVAQRQKAQVGTGNFNEEARSLARGFFEMFTSHAGKIMEGSPPLVTRGVFWRRWKLSREVQYLWRLAHGAPSVVTARELRRLPAVLDRVAQALADGRLTFLA